MSGLDDNGVVVTIFSNYSNQVGALISVMHAIVRGRVRAESPLGDLGLFFGAVTNQHFIEDQRNAHSCQLNDQHIVIWPGSSFAARTAGNLVASFIQGSVGRPVTRVAAGGIEPYLILSGKEVPSVDSGTKPAPLQGPKLSGNEVPNVDSETKPAPLQGPKLSGNEGPSVDSETKPPPLQSPKLHEVWVLQGWDCSEKRFQHILSMLLITPDEEMTSRMSRAARDFRGTISLNPKKAQLLLVIEMLLATSTAFILGIHPVLAMMVGRRITRAHVTSQKFASLSGTFLGARATIGVKAIHNLNIPCVAFEVYADSRLRSIFHSDRWHIFVTLVLLILGVVLPSVAWIARVWLPSKALSAFFTPNLSTKTLYLVIAILYTVSLSFITITLSFKSYNDHMLVESGFNPTSRDLASEHSQAELIRRQRRDFFRVKQELIVWNLIHLLIAIPIFALQFSIHRDKIRQSCNTLIGVLGLLSAFFYSMLAARGSSCRLRGRLWDTYAAFASFAFMILVFDS